MAIEVTVAKEITPREIRFVDNRRVYGSVYPGRKLPVAQLPQSSNSEILVVTSQNLKDNA